MRDHGADALTASLRAPKRAGRPALIPFLTAGYPRRRDFAALLLAVAEVADAVEIGVPFSDPMADGVTIQDTSRQALAQGVSLAWLLDLLAALPRRPAAPLLLMSYLNPMLARGLDRLGEDLAAAGVSGLIVPDLPYEECEPVRDALDARDRALVQLVCPLTEPPRLRTLCEASRGFVYAVTRTGTTGTGQVPADVGDYLRRVRACSPLPVCAGFGIAEPAHVEALAPYADGVIVGSALLRALAAGGSAVSFLQRLMGDHTPGGPR